MEVVLILLLSIHLLCVAAATGGPLLCVALEWREARGDSASGRAGRYLQTASLVLLVAGAVVGLGAGAVLWDDVMRDVVTRQLASKVFFGVWELVFSILCMVGHVVWWKLAPRPALWHRAVRMLLPLAAGTNLLYHFPVLFIVLSRQVAAGSGGHVIDASAFRHHMIDPEVLSRTLHFWLAAVTAGAIALLPWAWREMKRGGGAEELGTGGWGLGDGQTKSAAGRTDNETLGVVRFAARVALLTALLQFPVGIWVAAELPPGVQGSVLGGDLVATGLFGAAVLCVMVWLHPLAALSLGDVRPANMAGALAGLVAIMFLMTAVLERGKPRSASDDDGRAKSSRSADSIDVVRSRYTWHGGVPDFVAAYHRIDRRQDRLARQHSRQPGLQLLSVSGDDPKRPHRRDLGAAGV